MTDVLLRATNDNGDIEVINGVVTTDGGLATAAYLCLFGGNELDAGGSDETYSWWGNIGEPTERQYRSEFQYLVKSIPSIPANLRRLENAALRDLSAISSEVSVQASLVGPQRVAVKIQINGVDLIYFETDWGRA